MRTIPAALQTHLAGEVITLAKCLKITKSDGSILRLTTHDIDLTVGGSVYFAGVPLDISAIQSTDTLSVDNAEIEIGMDDERSLVIKTDFEDGLYDKAQFELFLVNWEDTTDGLIYLKRGELGDITFENETKAKVELRGLTQSLQRSVVERYSPTCRVNLGGKKCGVVNSPVRVRRNRQKVKTFDWFLVPNTNITVPVITNLGFEDDGAVANGITGITNWIFASGSYWQVTDAFAAGEGSFYLAGGNDGGSPGDGAEFTLYNDISVVDLGMVEAQVDTGDYSFDFASLIAATSDSVTNVGRLYVEQLDVDGKTLKLDATDWIEPDFQDWQGIGVTTFVVPNCRTIRYAIQARKNESSFATVAFDEVQIRFWLNQMDTFGGAVFRTMRIPTLDGYETFSVANQSWDDDGAVASGDPISSWINAAGTFEVVASAGAFTPFDGGFFLRATADGSILYQDVPIIDNNQSGSGPLPENITAGWYLGIFEVYVGRNDIGDDIVIKLEFFDVDDNNLATFTNTEASGTVDTWMRRTISGRAPTATNYARITVSGSNGAVFDRGRFHWIVTAFEKNPSDPETSNLAATLPTYDYTQLNYTFDESVVVQAQPLQFGIETVTDTVDARTFECTTISQTAVRMYSGKITWLSGNNAGKTSFIRIWDDTGKIAKLYHPLRLDIQIGDKFVWGRGCDKLIGTCSSIFGNATNFRGEPYLPGPNKVIEFLTTGSN